MTEQGSTSRVGGWTEVARALSTPAQPVSRQQVYVWWSRRAVNRFPSCLVCIPSSVGWIGGADHPGKHLFGLAEVADWYAQYRPSVGGRPRKVIQTDP